VCLNPSQLPQVREPPFDIIMRRSDEGLMMEFSEPEAPLTIRVRHGALASQ